MCDSDTCLRFIRRVRIAQEIAAATLFTPVNVAHIAIWPCPQATPKHQNWLTLLKDRGKEHVWLSNRWLYYLLKRCLGTCKQGGSTFQGSTDAPCISVCVLTPRKQFPAAPMHHGSFHFSRNDLFDSHSCVFSPRLTGTYIFNGNIIWIVHVPLRVFVLI